MLIQRSLHRMLHAGKKDLLQTEGRCGISGAGCGRTRVQTHQHGFTLIELLIVLTIVAVLLTMVVPAYNRYFTEARRADAHDMLQKNARILQNCLTLAGAFNAGCDLIRVSSDGHYLLSETITANTWQLSAVPTPDGPQASDRNCSMITLDNIGRKTATGLDIERCW